MIAVGAGRVFERFHLPALRTLPQWSLAGVVDSSPGRLAWAAAQIPGILTEHTLERLLSRIRPDAVLISSSPETHCALAFEAMGAGANVLIEKPMVLRVAEAEQLLNASRSLRRQVWVGFNRRFRPAYIKLRTRLASSAGGPVRFARFELRSDPLGWGSVSTHAARNDRAAAVLQDIASHQLDLVPWLLGWDPTRVQARFLQQDDRGTRIQVNLQFPDGTVASCLAGHVPGYVERLEVESNSGRWMAGPGGLMRQRVLPRTALEIWSGARTRGRALAHKLMRRPGDTLETFRRQYLAWADALTAPAETSATESAPAADGRAGARSVVLVDASRRSLALEGDWVDVTYPHTMTR